MNRQLTTLEPGTGPRTARPRRTRLAGRIATVIALLAAVLGLNATTAGSANAFVSVPNQFYAECSPQAVTALSPDMRYFPSYGVSWSAKLYVYTSYGWATYGSSSVQTAYGQNLLPAFSVWHPQESATWYSLPRGRYYQVRITAGWFGASSLLVNNAVIPHQLVQGNFNLTQKTYSTTSYCYIP
ncbi:hypothetical protein ISU10_11120 [Nocardioides agariphilus]|jgi:hypothetical protein|uniref:Uncharacterized protein n=1 Tax=Nocardioides agariphilus TaxID=433664 RepID=A0A930VKF4_9ACTN|nr:hypothetical protein [Nocardioides agariphilus]MBF4768318.1 hypothetical protein [Nocardioides agariphilus]